MADVTLTVTIPDAYVQRVIDAVTGYAGDELTLRAERSGPEQRYSYLAKQAGETAVEYGSRFLKEYIRAFVKLYELDMDMSRYNSDVQGVAQPSVNVPDGIVS